MICLTYKAKYQLQEVTKMIKAILFSLIFTLYVISLLIAIAGTIETIVSSLPISTFIIWQISCLMQLPIIALLIQQFGKWVYNSFEKC